MQEIRVAWNTVGRLDLVGTSIQGGLWHLNTPENLKTLSIILESDSEVYGRGSDWVEEPQT